MSDAAESSGAERAHSRPRRGHGFVIGAKTRIGRVQHCSSTVLYHQRRPTDPGARCTPALLSTPAAVQSWQYDLARAALRRVAVIIARNRFGRGRPNLWAAT